MKQLKGTILPKNLFFLKNKQYICILMQIVWKK